MHMIVYMGGRTVKEVLIIDDNQSSLELESFLRSKEYSPLIVDTVDKGLENINESENLKVVLLNVELSGMSGLDALQRIKREFQEVIVIVIRAGVKAARKAMRLGALDVMSKPIDMKHIHEVLRRAFLRLSIRSETSLPPEGEISEDEFSLVGDSELMFALNKSIGRVAENKVSVLIQGETGTGKGLVARLIHTESERSDAQFITVDCGAVPDELRESELLGYEGGAFTGARPEGRTGLFELADGGTLFLDEVGNMTPALQETLLNVLQTGQMLRLGGTDPCSVDVRVISATNQKLRDMVAQGEFREDLFYRLCGYEISLPPLRERIEDIPLLAAYFLQRIERENGKSMHGISEIVMELFQRYTWPGNVRELENCLKNATVNSQGEVILPTDLPDAIRKYKGEDGSEWDVQEMQSSENSEIPMYKNLFDLPLVVFCQFISDGKSKVTDDQITEWWVEFSNEGRARANKAKRNIDDWWVEWHTRWLTFPDLTDRIKKVIDDAVIQLSNFQHRMGCQPIEQVEPVSIIGRTLRGSLTAVMQEIVKGHGGKKEDASRELDISLEQLERWLSYGVEDDGYANEDPLWTSMEPSRKLERFPYEEIRRLLTEPMTFFILEPLSHIEWRDKSLSDQIRTVNFALKALSKRLSGDHGCICFGGMTFSQIERNIYRRAPYIYTSHAEAAKALNVDLRTFRQYWPEDKVFPSHHTLFTG